MQIKKLIPSLTEQWKKVYENKRPELSPNAISGAELMEYVKTRFAAAAITEEEYRKREKKAHALINYIGIGNIELIDYNHTPFLLKQGDRLLITSDGLYRHLSDKQIAEEVLRQADVKDTLGQLAGMSLQNARKRSRSRDNMTMILINVK